MVYYDFLSYDFVTRQFVHFCRFQVIYLLFLALVPLLGPPILSKVCQVVALPSFFFGSFLLASLGRLCGVNI